ncbi:LytTR family DNA-binding domain-containing protein [uncultured Kordia sp.]|uniref:LytR/AlgR family response regulator transcription factor n=1 Tax=uncultured Kordia sp. TaxID=507699 RepID=UPI002613F527|nr:LytTR family DNA-binding domain-containing protein [uncultured Kordia sp.]
MKNLKCLIVDDETPPIRLLESYIKKVPFLELVGSTSNPVEAIGIIENEALDLLFLDIQMPTITGIQLSKIVKDKVSVIFTTAYPKFALESYELNAVDYLLKPFEFERFYSAVLKVKGKNKAQSSTNTDDFIFIKTDGKNNFEKVFLNDILYIESLKNHVCIHTVNSQVITYNTLKNFETQLSKDLFIKTHKSYIVSIKNIVKTTTISVQMSNGNELPIGETYKKYFFEIINKLMF